MDYNQYNYLCSKGKRIESCESAETFIDEFLVDQPFDIYRKEGHIFINMLSGVNFYGEVAFSLDIYKNDAFRIEKQGLSVGPYSLPGLYESMDYYTDEH